MVNKAERRIQQLRRTIDGAAMHFTEPSEQSSEEEEDQEEDEEEEEEKQEA